MNKQYMDFVPSKSVKSVRQVVRKTPVIQRESTRVVRKTTRVVQTAKPVRQTQPIHQTRPVRQAKPVQQTQSTHQTRSTQQAGSYRVQEHTAPVRFAHEKQPVLGVVEDLSPKFVKTDVPKRPLGQKAHFNQKKTGVAAAKAKPIGNQKVAKVNKATVEKKKVEKSAKNTYRPPKTQFINQDKVVKRPLSKNIYVQKAEKTLAEEPQGPVTIISKPEKQAHVGMIVTIIITIILGAAAGTIAFLLLPK